MNGGLFFALLPVFLDFVVFWVLRLLGSEPEGLLPPFWALVRSLPAVALFWGMRWEEFARGFMPVVYGAYAGAVLEPSGVYGALLGALAGGLLLAVRSLVRRLFLAELVFWVAGVLLLTLVSVLLGAGSDWILPLLATLVVLLPQRDV